MSTENTSNVLNTSSTSGVGPFSTDAAALKVNYEPRMFKGDDAYSIYNTQTRFLLGKVLTVIDASYSDREQRKAMKDLVKQQFHAQEKHVYGIFVSEGNLICAAGEEMMP